MGYLSFFERVRNCISSQAGFLGLGWLVCLFLPSAAQAQTPDAEFVADYTEVSQTQYVTFTDLSTNADVWNWSISPSAAVTFVNGTSNQSNNPTVWISQPGVYTVTLVAGNSTSGKSDVLTMQDYITVLPSVNMCGPGNNITDTLKGQTGFLYDDGGPSAQYNPNRNCTVVIKPPCADSITLTFKSFDVSIYNAPGGDFLRVYDGRNSKGKSLHDSTGFYYGFQNQASTNLSVKIPTVKAVSGAMYIEWHTDGSNQGDGFEAKWVTHLRGSAPPHAKFTGPDTIYQNLKATFSSLSTGPELRYLWDLDDDGSFDAADVSVVSFTYASSGLVFVKMVAINCGGTDTFIRKIYVKAPKTAPKADFVADVTRLSAGDMVRFTDLSKEGPWKWKWSVIPSLPGLAYKYLNGTSNNSQNPQIQFLDSGEYTITLTATNNINSAVVTKTNYIYVYKHCVPSVKAFNPDLGISRVTVTNIAGDKIIDNTSAAGAPGYTSFGALGQTRLDVGGRYKIEVSRPSSANKLIGKVWIDYNGDGDFLDSAEEIYSNNSITTKTWGFSFVLPTKIKPGGSRMRIGVDYYSMGLNLCGPNPYGEFEDYAVNLVPDKIGPVITILGENPLSLEECLACTYEDDGAAAFDNVDGDVTDSIHTTIVVNLQKTGIDTVTYQVTDSVGNKSIAYRIIAITRDTTKPSVSIIGSDTVYHEVNTYFEDLGVSVSDNATLRANISVVTVSTVDSTKLGVYTITYTARDQKGNTRTKIRVVIVQDTTPPSITFTESDFLKHQIYTKFTDPGARVRDNYWPDTTYEVSGSVDVNHRGTYLLTYTATDGSGNTANVKRKVKVDDYIPPTVIVPSYYDTVELEVFHPYVDPPNIRMQDNFFANDELKLVRVGQVMEHFTGFYRIGYFAYDPSLNLSDTSWIIVHVVDLTPPKVYVLGKLVDTVMRWSKFIDSGYLAGDNYDSIIDVVIGGTFKGTQELGTFTRTYTAVDKSGNMSLPAIRWITVVQPAGIEELPSEIGLIECYPNPANSRVVLKVDLHERLDVRIYMTNMLGDNLGELYNGRTRSLRLTKDVSALPAGLYLVHYQLGDTHITRRLMIAR